MLKEIKKSLKKLFSKKKPKKIIKRKRTRRISRYNQSLNRKIRKIR